MFPLPIHDPSFTRFFPRVDSYKSIQEFTRRVFVLICEGETRSESELYAKYWRSECEINVIKISRMKIRDYFCKNMLTQDSHIIVCSGEQATKEYSFKGFYETYLLSSINPSFSSFSVSPLVQSAPLSSIEQEDFSSSESSTRS